MHITSKNFPLEIILSHQNRGARNKGHVGDGIVKPLAASNWEG